MNERSVMTDVGQLLLRLPVGVLFAFAGINKFRGGVGAFVEGASKAVPSFMPQVLGKAYLYCVPSAELIVGVCLLLGVLTRPISVIASLMLISFMIAVTGVQGQGGAPFHTNVVYFFIVVAIALMGPGRFSLDAMRPRRRQGRSR